MIKRLHILQAAVVTLCVWLSSSLAQENTPATAPEPDLRPKLTIQREGDDPIQIIQNAADAEGAQFILGNPNCKDEVRVSTFLAPAPGFVEMFINDMRITSTVALVDKPNVEGGGSGTPTENETIEMFGGSLELNDTRCPENVQRSTAADVTIEQGRSTTKGTLLNYDNATGEGDLTGPVALERTAEGDSPALSVSATDGLTINADENVSTFRGGVQTTSGGRSSSADTLEYNEEAGIAILRGSPARSQEGDDVVEGSLIEYDINSNDVVVKEKVRGTFEYNRE